MASRKVVQANSAFSTGMKRSILVEEGLRRLRNCSPELPWAKKIKFLNVFSSDLRYSGHTESFRMTLLKKVVGRYKTELSNHLEEKVRMFRTREEREQCEDRKRKNQKDTWFRSDGATSTLTVPVTPNGALADKIRKNILRGRQPTGTKVKVVEDGGVCSRSGLVKVNQFCREVCGRAECLLCYQKVGGNKPTNCVKSNVGYKGRCARCPERLSYLGETSRTAYTRIKEHFSDYRSAAAARVPPQPQPQQGDQGQGRRKNVKSWMWEHSRDYHGGLLGQDGGKEDYEFCVSGVFKKCLDMQVDEGFRILECESETGVALNSKNEWFTPRIVETVFRQQ